MKRPKTIPPPVKVFTEEEKQALQAKLLKARGDSMGLKPTEPKKQFNWFMHAGRKG